VSPQTPSGTQLRLWVQHIWLPHKESNNRIFPFRLNQVNQDADKVPQTAQELEPQER